MKKVLHIMNSLLPSGAETMLYSSADYWDKDLEKHILATTDDLGIYASELKKAGYIIHHLHEHRYFKQHKKVRGLIRKYQFDIVHVHRQGQAFSYELDGKMAGAKCIVRTVHNVFVFHGLVQVREFITRQLACLIGVKHVSIGKSVHENEWNRFHVQCTMIRNWYNEKRFYFTTDEMKREARKKLNISPLCYCIVSVGNCTAVKNHMSILKAIVKYKDDPLFEKLLYLHVGKGLQEADEKKFAEDNGIMQKIKFVGFDDPVLFLQAADLYLMPSIYEGFSISAVESLATGLNSIFTDVFGLKDFKHMNLENLTYCQLSDEAIAQAIYDQVKKGQRMCSKKQAEMIRNSFGIAGGVEMYQEIYFHK